MGRQAANKVLAALAVEARLRKRKTGRACLVPAVEFRFPARRSPGVADGHLARPSARVKARTAEGRVGGMWLRTWRVPGWAY